MSKIIAVANQKGGVAKTTTAVNLSAALHGMGKKILLVDLDPQGNAGSGMGVSKSGSPNTYEMLMKGVPAAESVYRTEYGDIIPSGKDLAAASLEMADSEEREYILKKALLPIKLDYDYIFIEISFSAFLDRTLNTGFYGGFSLCPSAGKSFPQFIYRWRNDENHDCFRLVFMNL